MGKKHKIILTVLIAAHLAIALPLAFYLNVWTDEASTLYTTGGGFMQAFHHVFADEKQAPLYFLLMSLWRKIDDSVFFARVFSMLCSAAAILAFSNLARKIWEEKTALFVTGMFALHPLLVWASVEIRLYALVILMTCLLFSSFYKGFLRDEDAADAKKSRIFYVFFAIAAVYIHYYLGFVLVGAFAALLVTRRMKAARCYFLLMILAGLAILPLFWIILTQFGDRTQMFTEERSILTGIRLVWNHFLTFVLPTELFPAAEQSALSLARVWMLRLALLAALVLLIKNKFRQFDADILVFGTISLVCAVFFLGVYFQLGTLYVSIRHAAVYFVAVFIFAAAALVKLVPTRKARFLITPLYAVFFVYAYFAIYPEFTKRGDWARVAEFVQKNEKPNQTIVVFPNYDAVALPVYYRGANKILPDENLFSLRTDAPDGTAESLRSQTEALIKEIPPETTEIWLLTGERCEIKESCALLENYVDAHYTVVEEKMFYLEKVRLLRKKND